MVSNQIFKIKDQFSILPSSSSCFELQPIMTEHSIIRTMKIFKFKQFFSVALSLCWPAVVALAWEWQEEQF